MREPERIERIIKKLQNLWNKYPDQRFLQLIFNLQEEYALYNDDFGLVGDAINGPRAYDHFYLEDTDFENFLDDKIKKGKI